MPTILVFHHAPKGKPPCQQPLAKIRIQEGTSAHQAAWTYQRTRLAPQTAAPCPGCGRRVGNQIGFRVLPREADPVLMTRAGPIKLERKDE